MQRRSFLKMLSVSSVLSLAAPDRLISAEEKLVHSQFLGFSLRHPKNWTVLTLFDEFDKHLGEWGGMSADSYRPLVILSRFREPTKVPNHEIQVYPLGSIYMSDQGVDRSDASAVFSFLASQREDIFDLKPFVDCPGLREGAFSATWRTCGPDGTYDFLGYFHIVDVSPNPLLIVRASPRNEDDIESAQILASLRIDSTHFNG